MLTHPRLKYCYHAEFLDDEKVLLVSEKDQRVLSGRRYIRILSEIHQKGVAIDELLERLEPEMSSLEVYYALDVLEKKGYLTEAVSGLPAESAAYWSNQEIEPQKLLHILNEKTISLETIGTIPADVFREAFSTIGVNIDEEGMLRVVISDEYDRHRLRIINRKALKTGTPWLLVKPVGTEFWIGPLFLPGKTGCYTCLQQRLRMNRPLNAYYKMQTGKEGSPPLPVASTPLSLQIAANQTALEVAKWLYFGFNKRIEGRIIAFDTRNMETRPHTLTKRPQCLDCGDVLTHNTGQPIILKRSTIPCVNIQGGYRDRTPEETLTAYQHHVSPISGVVPCLQPYFNIDGAPVYNYSSGPNLALQSKTLFQLNSHLRSGNGGKGKTWSQAKAGALCESIERYSGIYQGNEVSITTSLHQLGERGIHPNACMNYSEQQYRNRDVINRTCSRFYALVPAPFDESLEMEWTSIYSLTEQSVKYLPTCFCYAQYPVEDEWKRFSYPDSNGGAAGNSIEEAILQGFLELVERDSVALWWYNMLRKPAVDVLSFNEPYFQQLITYYRSLHRHVHVLDLTADLEIPTFGAISYRTDDATQDIIFAFGAHVDATIAIERALIELNQILPIANVPESERKQGKYRTKDPAFLTWLKTATLENQPYLLPREDAPLKTAADYPRLCEAQIYDSIMFCLKTAAKHDLETLVLDLTRPDIGLPVVKVVVPGLRHFWQRLAPGRLYNVLVKMGWLEHALREDELNPIGLFI